MAKVILIAQLSLPYSKIGSWTTLYHNYLKQQHQIDFIICPEPEQKYSGIKYEFANKDLLWKIRRRILGKHYTEYLNALRKIIIPGEKYIIQIIDNPGLTMHLGRFLAKHSLVGQCYVQFFHHGFGNFFSGNNSKIFFEIVDEMVMLTMDSYKFFRQYYEVLPCRFSMLHNGIDTEKFYRISVQQKHILKEDLNVSGKTVFIWCSQDKPKKGLDFILMLWKKIYTPDKNMVLWIIGAKRNLQIEGVNFFGRIPNEQLPRYFQTSDVYLFPTLCHEGFGLSLIEALHCGNYCIASALGGVPEVLQYGTLGKLIANPNIFDEWESAIQDFLSYKYPAPKISKELYSTSNWCTGMNDIISAAKTSFENG